MKLLLAEDELELSRALTAILEYSGYDVDAVYNGQDALNKGLVNYYDIMVLDIMMPIMDGITALKNLRKANITTPVLMLTAKATSDDTINGLDAGADDYLTKPFIMKELLARIRALIRRKQKSVVREINSGNIVLKMDTYELAHKETAVRLSNYEFYFIELLMRNKNKDISNKKLIETIKSEDEKADDYFVNVYMTYLKNKLKMLGANIRIVKLEDGYRLEDDE